MGRQRLAVAAGEVLTDRARSRHRSEAPITYGDLAEVLGLEPFRGPDWGNHPLSRILGELNREDNAAGRPFRSVLVIGSRTGYSGHSFFVDVAELRFGGVPIPEHQHPQFWRDEFSRLLRHHNNSSAEAGAAPDPAGT